MDLQGNRWVHASGNTLRCEIRVGKYISCGFRLTVPVGRNRRPSIQIIDNPNRPPSSRDAEDGLHEAQSALLLHGRVPSTSHEYHLLSTQSLPHTSHPGKKLREKSMKEWESDDDFAAKFRLASGDRHASLRFVSAVPLAVSSSRDSRLSPRGADKRTAPAGLRRRVPRLDSPDSEVHPPLPLVPVPIEIS